MTPMNAAIGLFTGIRSLKTPGPGAVAHMSLHLKPTMSKSQHPNPPHQRQNKPDNHRTPIFNLGGLLSVYGGDRGGRAVEAAFPSGEAASKHHPRFGQTVFSRCAKFLSGSPVPGRSCLSSRNRKRRNPLGTAASSPFLPARTRQPLAKARTDAPSLTSQTIPCR